MVIYIKQLDGKNVKKSLNVHRVGKQWHNKNKSGGNFGINIFPNNDRRYIFQMHGYYNVDGEVYNLTFGEGYHSIGMKIIGKENYKQVTYQELMIDLKKKMQYYMQTNVR